MDPRTNEPTEVQVADDVHDTPLSVLLAAPAGFWVFSSVQLCPSHTSASVVAPDMPVAMQALAAGHDSPARTLLVAPAGFGVGWIDQRTPFHRSAKVTVRVVSRACPTAVQAVADEHDTALRAAAVAPAGALIT
jgi:hypothetical protein